MNVLIEIEAKSKVSKNESTGRRFDTGYDYVVNNKLSSG
jgi:hypothetical protein